MIIHFNDAAGIEAEKTRIRFRGINVGKVEKVTLTEDAKGVIVIARLDREAKSLAVEESQFLIVQPQFDFQGIRGLDTVFKGSYIRVDLGKGKPHFDFKGGTEGATTDPNAGVISYYLRSNFVESIGTGDSINYRGLKIGSVIAVTLSPSGQFIDTEIGIEKKYVKLIRDNTAFWQNAGIEANLGLFGSKIKVSSLESMIKGGITIAVPSLPGKIANADSRFELLKNAPKDSDKWSPEL